MLREFSDIIYGIQYKDLPPHVIHKAKMLILNFIGGALPGCDSNMAQCERRLWDMLGGAGESSVLGQKGKVSAIGAAAINASMGQVFLEEECHDSTATHPGVATIPAGLAVAQSLGSTGQELIEAVVAGIEGMARIAKCLQLPGFTDNGLRGAAITAPFGACITACKLMKLGPEKMCDAIGVAGNYAAGYMEYTNTGTEDICIQNGNSARMGVIAAYEASFGAKGAPSILEGRFGLGMALNNRPCDWSLMTKPIEVYEIEEMFVKPYPSCGHVLATAEAITRLCGKNEIVPEQIKKITIGTRRGGVYYPGCNNAGPFAGTISAMTSHQYITATRIVNGGIYIRDIKNFADPAVYEVSKDIDLVVDSEIDSLPDGGSRIDIEMKDGRVLTEYQPMTSGLSDEGIRQRLIDNAEGYFSPERAQKILALCEKLEELDNAAELCELMESNI